MYTWSHKKKLKRLLRIRNLLGGGQNHLEKFDRMDKTFFRYMTQIPSILGQFSVGVCVCVCVCGRARAGVCVW